MRTWRSRTVCLFGVKSGRPMSLWPASLLSLVELQITISGAEMDSCTTTCPTPDRQRTSHDMA